MTSQFLIIVVLNVAAAIREPFQHHKSNNSKINAASIYAKFG